MVCDKCGKQVPEGGFLCRNCGNDCRGFIKDMPAAPKKLIYKESPTVEKKHVGGFISSTEEAMNYGYNVDREEHLAHIDKYGNLYNPKKKKFKDEIRPFLSVMLMRIVAIIVLALTAISVFWMFLYAEEIGDVAKNVFITEFIKAFGLAVSMIGLSLSTIIFAMTVNRD